MKIELKQQKSALSQAALNTISHLIILLPQGCLKTGSKQAWPKLPYETVLKQRLKRSGELDAILTTDLPNKASTHVTLVGIKEESSRFEQLTLARQLAAPHLTHNPATISVIAPGFTDEAAAPLFKGVVAALLAASSEMPSFKSKAAKPSKLRTIQLHGVAKRIDFSRTIAEANGNNLARQLTTLPPNELTPASYRRRITKLSRENGWKLAFLDQAALKRKKAGAFLAVCQGSSERDAGIVHLRYTPKRGRRQQTPLALVGKGICFDTGGTNLKPAQHMHGMHEDMQGSAVALGTFLTLSQLKVPYVVDCWLALAQNHIGPNAYKQNDVVTASNGVTIEVMHTDAEGRMVLADTLVQAARCKPALIIDYATLTGACHYSLSARYSGGFTNRDVLIDAVISAGRKSGERVWPFPIDKDFDDELKSDIADVKQCTLGGEADHILASRFLQRFVADTPWLHLDLSSANSKGGLAHIPTDITGFGVSFTTQLLFDNNALSIIKDR
ncbi:MAG TPA: leucyl aminopeptidase family protein [Chromatiales bacterium]|nr:leucyl aminopeptidase family protein [Chromatiales bacterium]